MFELDTVYSSLYTCIYLYTVCIAPSIAHWMLFLLEGVSAKGRSSGGRAKRGPYTSVHDDVIWHDKTCSDSISLCP